MTETKRLMDALWELENAATRARLPTEDRAADVLDHAFKVVEAARASRSSPAPDAGALREALARVLDTVTAWAARRGMASDFLPRDVQAALLSAQSALSTPSAPSPATTKEDPKP